MCRGWSAMGVRLCQCKNTQSVSTNTQGMISNGNETLSMENTLSVNTIMQGMISDGNETLSMWQHTSCERKCAGDDQQWEWDRVNAETHMLRAQLNVQGMIKNGSETLSMQKRTLFKHKCAGDDQQKEWDSVNAGTHNLWAQMCRGWSATGMRLCQCSNILPVSTDAQGMISNRSETLSMQKRTTCEHKYAGDDQKWEWDSFNAEAHHLWAQEMISNRNKTLLMQKRTACEHRWAGDD